MRRLVTLALGALVLFPALVAAAPPAGWYMAGSDPKSYELQRDTEAMHNGKASGRLASIQTPKGFGTMMQNILPGEYLGKRIKFAAWVKSSELKDHAGLWMRVDGPENKSLSFDNMDRRPIKGTTDWTRYEIVLDVPREAIGIFFGILVSGEGTAWMNDAALTVVDKSVPVTDLMGLRKEAPRQPVNLDFSN